MQRAGWVRLVGASMVLLSAAATACTVEGDAAPATTSTAATTDAPPVVDDSTTSTEDATTDTSEDVEVGTTTTEPSEGSGGLDGLDEEALAPMLGTWEGSVTQPSSPRSPYDVVLVLAWDEDDDEIVGSTVYPDLDSCEGELDDARIEDGALVIDEHIVSGTESCADTTLILRLDGDELSYRFDELGTGWGTLTRTDR